MNNMNTRKSYSWYMNHRCVLSEYERHIIATTDVQVIIVPTHVVVDRSRTRVTSSDLPEHYNKLISAARSSRESRQEKKETDFYGRRPTTATKGLTRTEIQARMQMRVEVAGRMWADGSLTINSLCDILGVTQNVASIAIREAKKQGLIKKPQE